MADTLTRVFRTFASQDQVRKELTETPSIYSTLVVGEQNISRSLLLLTAVTAASQQGVKAVFFTQTHIQQLPLFLQKRGPILNAESLKVLNTFLSRVFYRCFVFVYWTNTSYVVLHLKGKPGFIFFPVAVPSIESLTLQL